MKAITDLRKFKRAKDTKDNPIECCSEDYDAYSNLLFGCPVRIVGITDDGGNIIAFTASPGPVVDEDCEKSKTHPLVNAADNWQYAFGGCYFNDPGSIFMTWLDCIVEQLPDQEGAIIEHFKFEAGESNE